MSGRTLWITTLVLTLAAGCGRCRSAPPSANEQPQPADTPKLGEEPHDQQLAVQIQPEMLRDLRLTTARVETRTGAQTVTALGEIQVNQAGYAEVGVPTLGRVVEVLVDLGMSVRRGQRLAVLHSPELGRARADFHAARARVRLAEQTLQRKRELAAERIAPARDVEQAEAEASSADAGLRAALATLEALGVNEAGADDNSSTYPLLAPATGTVITRDLVIGQMVEPAKTVFRIANLRSLWLVVHAFERDAVHVQPGAPSRAFLPALPGQTFGGRVSLVGREVDATSGTIPIRIDLTNPNDVLRPGMTASAEIDVAQDDATLLSVPVAAVQRLADNWVVFVPKGPADFEIRIVGRGRDLGREVEIVRGLQAGDTVVVDGAFVLRAEAEKLQGGQGEHHE